MNAGGWSQRVKKIYCEQKAQTHNAAILSDAMLGCIARSPQWKLGLKDLIAVSQDNHFSVSKYYTSARLSQCLVKWKQEKKTNENWRSCCLWICFIGWFYWKYLLHAPQTFSFPQTHPTHCSRNIKCLNLCNNSLGNVHFLQRPLFVFFFEVYFTLLYMGAHVSNLSVCWCMGLCFVLFQRCVVGRSLIPPEWCCLQTGLKLMIKARTAFGGSMWRRTSGSCWTSKCA